MKKIRLFSTALLVIAMNASFAQEMGNVNYGGNRYQHQQQPMNNITYDNGEVFTVSVRGIYNEKPTMYAATFSIVQVGTTLEEIDGLMNEKINNIKEGIKQIDPSIEVITDMISFVPVYEYEVSKKLFNKKTYNEKPAGYELKKNLIIKYKTRVLDKITTVCAAQEVYDLVKVDYIITNLDSIKAKLQAKTLEEYANKLKFYSQLKGEDLSQKQKTIAENYNLVYPVESYASYTAFSRSQLPFSKNSVVSEMVKNEARYYNPVMVKAHTYVVNPEIVEPCVQIFYDLTVVIKLKKEEPQKQPAPQPTAPAEKKSIYIITHQGDLRKLEI